jgi:hypothetical protein
MAQTGLLGLDFQDYRDDLLAYLRTRPQFRDYDFTGSNLRVLVDLLAHHGWKEGFYANMSLSEGFLGSAQLRSSVLSRAKDLNYLPRSATSATASLTVSFEAPSLSTYLLQKGSSFSSAVEGRSLTFTLPETVLIVGSGGSFSKTISVAEGPYFSESYVWDPDDETLRVLLSNEGADVASLSVRVFEDGQTRGTGYTLAPDMLGLDESSRVFFLQLDPDGKYRVVFGDGVVGRSPSPGSLIVLDYRVTVGEGGNGAQTFQSDWTPEGSTGVTVVTVEGSSGGAGPESLESVRKTAPRHFRTQLKATSDEDYGEILREKFPEILQVSVQGGEELDPPLYGKVMVSVDVSGTDRLSEGRKKAYSDWLRPRCPKTVVPLFRSPDFLWTTVSSVVDYDSSRGDLSPDLAEAVVRTSLETWGTENLGGFGVPLRYSRLVAAVDGSDPGIAGNDTSVTCHLRTRPSTLAPQSMVLNYGFPLALEFPREGTTFPDLDQFAFWTGPYGLGGDVFSLRDDGEGGVFSVKTSGGVDRVVKRVGTVDYETGVVRLSGWEVGSYAGDFIRAWVRPRGRDVPCPSGTILKLENEDVSVRVETVSV